MVVVFGIEKFKELEEFCSSQTTKHFPGSLLIPDSLGKLVVEWLKSQLSNFNSCTCAIFRISLWMFCPICTKSTKTCSGVSCCRYALLDFLLVFDSLLLHQQQDSELSVFLSELQERGTHSPYSLSNEVLCYRPRRGWGPKVVLPNILVPIVLQFYTVVLTHWLTDTCMVVLTHLHTLIHVGSYWQSPRSSSGRAWTGILLRGHGPATFAL